MVMFILPSCLIFLNSPFSMIILLIINTSISSFLIYQLLSTAWYSLMMMLIMVGGMMIIFIYMASLIPKQPMKWKHNLTTKCFLTTSGITMATYLIPYRMAPYNQLNLSPALLFSFPSTCVMMISLLVITLIAITKITNLNKGPLSKMP